MDWSAVMFLSPLILTAPIHIHCWDTPPNLMKKHTHLIWDDLQVSAFTAHFNFWVNYSFKVPLLCVMKGSCVGFGIPINRLTFIQGQKALSFSYNMHIFYLVSSTIHFSKLLLCVMILCSDWSISFKAVLLCVQRYLYLTLQKCQQVGGKYANVSCWRHTGIGFKNDWFQWFRVDSFFREIITLYTMHFQI